MLREMTRSKRRPARMRARDSAPAQPGGEPRRRAPGHVPVLAHELLQLLDPRPGQVAIDCTFGDGGHARLLARRLGPTGTLVAIDRDPLAEERFDALAGELPCAVRFLRSGYAEALQLLVAEGLRADIAYFDLRMSRGAS